MIIIALMGIMRFAIRVKDILDIIDEALLRKGLSASAASKLAVGNPSLIKNMRQETGYKNGSTPSLSASSPMSSTSNSISGRNANRQ